LAKIIKSEFGKNVLTLMTGSTISQIIPLALIPVLTRLFSPEEFGVYTFYMSLITFFLVVSAGRYEQAIVLPKEKKEAINVLGLSFSILFAFVSILFLILLLFKDYIEYKINLPILNDWLWFLPICVFFASSYRILTYWSNRNKRFKGTSYSVISQTGTRMTTQLVGGVEKYQIISEKGNLFTFFKSIFKKSWINPEGVTPLGVGSLIISYAVGFLIGTLVLLFPFIKNDRKLLKEISWSEMKTQAKVYEKFPKINSLHSLGDELKNFGVTSTLLYVFGDMVLGFYSMTFRILRAPLSVIGNSFAQVFYQKAAEMHANKQNYVPLVDKTVKKLALIALPIFLTILFFGPFLFEFVLGDKWRVAGEYAQYLTPWLFLNFIISPIQQIGIIVNKQGVIFLFSLLGNAIIFGSIFIGGYVFDNVFVGFIILSSLQVFYYLWVYLWIKSEAKKDCEGF
jgi:O-antigen/teichoic acid export membrane protein